MNLLAICVLVGALTGQGFEPARLRTGSLPGRPSPQVVAGGQVLLEVAVGADGAVAEITTLRDTPPFTNLLREAVAGWRFDPATENGRPLPWPVLVVGLFRPPVLAGPAAGTPPRDALRACLPTRSRPVRRRLRGLRPFVLRSPRPGLPARDRSTARRGG